MSQGSKILFGSNRLKKEFEFHWSLGKSRKKVFLTHPITGVVRIRLLPEAIIILCTLIFAVYLLGDTRALSLRLFSEMASVFLDGAQFDAARHKAESQKLQNIIAEALLPQ